MAQVVFENVSKRYGDTLAVDRLNLEVQDREFLVLVGPSGCGKSTTLRLVAGLEDLDEGSIRIGDRDVSRVPPRDRDVAMVFQNYALYPHMTAFDNMAFGLKMRKASKAEIQQRVSAAAETLDIVELLKRKPHQLSGGQRQRVAVGRAIVRDPAVFLFDEPLSNLDARLRLTMRSELVQLQERLQTTMIYVTHDQVEAMMMGHRVVVMHGGRMQQVGTPAEIYSRPANRFVAEFIGNPPMNFLKAWVHVEADGIRLHFEASQTVLQGKKWERVAAKNGCGVLVGVRPEDVDINPADPGEGKWRRQAQVTAVHSLGPETIAHVQCNANGPALTVRLGPRHALKRDDAVTVQFDPEKMHLFEETTGGRI